MDGNAGLLEMYRKEQEDFRSKLYGASERYEVRIGYLVDLLA